jgi:hypothetical protein
VVEMRVWFKSSTDLIDFLHLIKRLDPENEVWQKAIEESIENVRVFRETFNGTIKEYEVRILFAHDVLPIRDIQIIAHVVWGDEEDAMDLEEWAEAVDDP